MIDNLQIVASALWQIAYGFGIPVLTATAIVLLITRRWS